MNDWPINGLSIQLPAVLPAVGALGAQISGDLKDMKSLLDDYWALGGHAVMISPDAEDQTIRLLGQWMKDLGQDRDGLIWIGMGSGEVDAGPRMRKTVLERRLLHSLELVEGEAMDLYLLEGDDPNVHVGYILEGMNALRQKGYCRAFGAHGWSMERLREAARHAERSGVQGFSCASLSVEAEYAAGSRPIGEADEAWLIEHKLPVLLQAGSGVVSASQLLQELVDGRNANELEQPDKQDETIMPAAAIADMLRRPYSAAAVVPAGAGQADDIIKAAQAWA
ncbi:hypothetical protein DNH61_14865 [Paenibacillus sambharensis]|uniref:NADP-dependent oxidoreductase domain-containing protein n=1 Tax=Paenibacillus sambharensis TaxID=1803190 RepID=A0A2W1L7G2_9BACL|nr:aldo/keto reductase [Paenibacillus sambharensis]PZD94923.1 hypothetical protein DNH61_14865 [Paenibacillus sambharensis]